jgi:hypothetical protein
MIRRGYPAVHAARDRGGSSVQRAHLLQGDDMSLRVLALSAFGAFVISGPMQHIGAIPQTFIGDASKAAIKSVMKAGVKEAHACFGSPKIKGNNGWGNGFDPINAGSGSGGTAPSKTANGTAGPGINTNPTTSDGR